MPKRSFGKPESFGREWSWQAAAPSQRECEILLGRLVRRFPLVGVCGLLGVHSSELKAWRGGERMTLRERRLVWLVYAVMIHPELVRTPFDILTGGRYVGKQFGGPMRTGERVEDYEGQGVEWSQWEI